MATRLDDRSAWVLAVGPFIALAGILRQVPDGFTAPAPMPWSHAIAHSAILFGLMAAHAACYRLWTPHAPNRMLVNEFLTRIWFIVFGLLVVGLAGEEAPIFFVMAAPWAVASWCTHYLLLRREGAYVVASNVAVLGLFLVGAALIGLVAISIGLG